MVENYILFPKNLKFNHPIIRRFFKNKKTIKTFFRPSISNDGSLVKHSDNNLLNYIT